MREFHLDEPSDHAPFHSCARLLRVRVRVRVRVRIRVRVRLRLRVGTCSAQQT